MGGIYPYSISIHFLYTEEDESLHPSIRLQAHFNPLPLYRGRHQTQKIMTGSYNISIHFLYTEEDIIL